MSIQIDMIRISGFRGISNLEMSLPRVTVLFAQNNAGKTSIMKALQLALGDYSRYLSDEDFHIHNNDKCQEQITIDLRFIPISDGEQSKKFSDAWVGEFKADIQSGGDGQQFVAIRTIAKADPVKGGYAVDRFSLGTWPTFEDWLTVTTKSKTKAFKKLDAIPFIAIDAQRDIHQELKEKSSFIGRVLADIKYNDDDVAALEEMVADINQTAVDKSQSLKKLKGHLDDLNQSINSTGKTELTPFPKKIRDLSKQFTVHFGESTGNTFSMEYHGMGTRSWASMLAVKAFTDLMGAKYDEDAKPFYPIIAAEEPEAHLHPNAQRSLFKQLSDSPGQVIISTHSPYLVGMAKFENLRGLVKRFGNIQATQLVKLDTSEVKKINREVLRLRGELLFSKVIILFEGVTEEQIIPSMFELFFEKTGFELGVNFIAVGGKGGYSPFIKMASGFGIPVCILSDNDGDTQQVVESQVKEIKNKCPSFIDKNNFYLSYLSTGNDIEAELLQKTDLRDEINTSIIKMEMNGSNNERWFHAKLTEISGLNDDDILLKMRDKKAEYSNFLADEILANKNNKTNQQLMPKAVIDIFTQIQKWIS